MSFRYHPAKVEFFLSVTDLAGSKSDKSFGDRLKNAISEPLANADNKSNNAANTAANNIDVVGGLNSIRFEIIKYLIFN